MGALPSGIKNMCKQTDQASAALITDLNKEVCSRIPSLYGVANLGEPIIAKENLMKRILAVTTTPGVFLMDGRGGVKPGYAHGQTDEYSYNVVNDGVHA